MLRALVIIFCLLASGCESKTPVQPSANVTLILWNWPNYMTRATLDQFTAETGIHVEERIFSDEEVLLGAMDGSDFKADLLIVSENSQTELSQMGRLLPVDAKLLPNLRHLDPESLNRVSRNGQLHSIPYLAGTTGLIINTRHVPEGTDSWNVLWDDRLRGRIAMLGNNFEVVSTASLKLGYGILPDTEGQFQQIKKELERQRPLLKGYLPLAEITDGMITGDIWAALIFSGDALSAVALNPDLRYIIPREGASRWQDVLVISKRSAHPAEAHAFIDFLHRPEVMAKLSEDLYCATPNAAARTLLSSKILADPAIYPSRKILDKCAFFPDLPPSDTRSQRVSEIWNSLKAP